ncbi:Myb/SANT-like DNA-binding domain [Popillia japonica]|uniref:Regulatory protein zeste n=1 Tax=Popillia japonica TaxID=7064 RepID=A0AAW1L643_POPJA
MGRAQSTTLWNRIVNQLNSLGYGTKTIEEWRKAVTDWKCKVKAKAAKLRNQQINTGGGEAKYLPLTNPEERLLKIIGSKGINGDGVPELGISVPGIVINETTEMQLFSNTSNQGIREDKNSCTIKKRRRSDFLENVAVELEVDGPPIPSTSKDLLQADHPYSINTPSTSNTIKRFKSKHRTLMNQDLLDMNKDSLNILKSMNEKLDILNTNPHRISEAMVTMANHMADMRSKK